MSIENFVLRHTGVERGGEGSRDVLPFSLSFCPTAGKISLSLKAGKAQTGLAKGTEAALDAYIQEGGLEAWTFLVTWALNFVFCNRHGERAERPETLSVGQAEALAQLRKYIRGFLSGPRCLIWIGKRAGVNEDRLQRRGGENGASGYVEAVGASVAAAWESSLCESC